MTRELPLSAGRPVSGGGADADDTGTPVSVEAGGPLAGIA